MTTSRGKLLNDLLVNDNKRTVASIRGARFAKRQGYRVRQCDLPQTAMSWCFCVRRRLLRFCRFRRCNSLEWNGFVVPRPYCRRYLQSRTIYHTSAIVTKSALFERAFTTPLRLLQPTRGTEGRVVQFVDYSDEDRYLSRRPPTRCFG